VAKSADDACRSAVEFAADEGSGAGQFVGNGFQTGLQLVAMRVAASAIVSQRFHPRDANAEIDKTFAPGTPE
jgi:hypothetical protein